MRAGVLVLWLALTGMNASAAQALGSDRVASVEVVGSAFQVRTTSGRMLAGRALEGATLTLVLADAPQPVQVRLDSIKSDVADSSFLEYEMSIAEPRGKWRPLCEPDAAGARVAFPLAGQWDALGRRVSSKGITLVCAAGGAIGKCVSWGYRPWLRLPDGTTYEALHQACMRMVQANYCGGRATPADGMKIDFYDASGVVAPDDRGSAAAGLDFEAAWSAAGAICVAHPRVPAHISLGELQRTCPALAGRLGPKACDEARARAGGYGKALLFNRSHP